MVINELVQAVTNSYFDVSLAANIVASIQAKAQSGGYDGIASGQALAKALTDDLRAVGHDKHLYVIASAAPLSPPQSPSAADVAAAQQKANYFNEDLVAIERLPGNIGRLQLNSFYDLTSLKGKLATAMNFLADTDALLIDLRRNVGGSSSGYTLLASYFFGSDTVDLNDAICDRGCPSGIPSDNNTIHETTVSDIGGTSYGSKPVYILTSSTTFSAAEAFTYALQARKRAFVIGEITGGGAHPTRLIQLETATSRPPSLTRML